MKLDAITLDFFRNITHLSAKFDSGVNLIYGENAQGKTNLIEGIDYLSCARSHRARFDKEMIYMGTDHAFIRGEITARERAFVIEANLHRGKKRNLYSNGVPLKSAAALGGVFQTVLFCPEDLSLVRAGAAQRRSFLNAAISQLRPNYITAMDEYRKLHEHKLRILCDWEKTPSLLQTLDDFNLRIAQVGTVIIHYRAHYIKRLQEITPLIHRDFSGMREEISLQYQTVSTVEDPLASQKEIFSALLSHQETHKQAELAARRCLCGPHKDDLLIFINDMQAKTFASQGQTRTAALSLKLAQREISMQETNEIPVLLLDDVLSELDSRRQAFVLNHIQGGQIFITCCEEEKLYGLKKGNSLCIHQGQLIEKNK